MLVGRLASQWLHSPRSITSLQVPASPLFLSDSLASPLSPLIFSLIFSLSLIYPLAGPVFHSFFCPPIVVPCLALYDPWDALIPPIIHISRSSFASFTNRPPSSSPRRCVLKSSEPDLIAVTLTPPALSASRIDPGLASWSSPRRRVSLRYLSQRQAHSPLSRQREKSAIISLLKYIHARGRPLGEMLKKKSLHPPLLFWQSSPASTPELSPTSSSSDTESDEDMDPSGSRPLSLAVPQGTFCPMRPNLDEVLANTAPAPYTLGAFMAYLSQNHCLETLEFTLDAKRYREAYESISSQLAQFPITSDCPESRNLRMLWQRLLSAYIFPGSPREINVSSEVRDDILRHAKSTAPPLPSMLDAAVKLVHDLMEESIFMPFLNAHSSSAHVYPLSEPLFSQDDGGVTVVSNQSLDEHAVKRIRSKGGRLSPRASKELKSPVSSSPPSGHLSRTNFSLSAVTSLGKSSHRTSTHPSSTASGDGLTDDSGSLQSSSGEPMTPPTTPPSSEPGMQASSPRTRVDNPWKKMSMKFGFKKRGGGSQSMRLSPEE